MDIKTDKLCTCHHMMGHHDHDGACSIISCPCRGFVSYTCLISTKCAEATGILDADAEYKLAELTGDRVNQAPSLNYERKIRRMEESADAKMRKAYQRIMTGGKIGRLVMVTLTTPDTFKGDMHRAWRLFRWRLRNRKLMREYFAVREWNKKHTCEHLHVIFRTEEEMSVHIIRQCWLAAVNASSNNADYDSVWTHHRWVYDERGMGNYLCKYLVKAMSDELFKRAYWYSLDWIVRGYAGLSKALWLCGHSLDTLGIKMLRQSTCIGYAQYRLLRRVSAEVKRGGWIVEGYVEREIEKAWARTIKEVLACG